MKTRAQLIADELKALYVRHGLNRTKLAKRALERKIDLDATTIWRIQQGKQKTEPRADTLRKIADAVGETRATAFPSSLDGFSSGDPVLDELMSTAKRLSSSDRGRLLERAYLLLEGPSQSLTEADDRAQLLFSVPAPGERPRETLDPGATATRVGILPKPPKKGR